MNNILYKATLGRLLKRNRKERNRRCENCRYTGLVIDSGGYVEMCHSCHNIALVDMRYLILKEIRRGSFSVTMEAIDIYSCEECRRNPSVSCDKKGHKKVCLKIMREGRQKDGLKELEASEKVHIVCDNDSVCFFKDSFQMNIDGKIFHVGVMDLYKSLGNMINRGMSSEQIKKLCLDILSVLEKIHGSSIIHGDIKPDNILYSKNRYYLTDFGMSVDMTMLSRPKKIQSCLTRPPEILMSKEYNEKSDIWSFGCLLCYIVTKKYPFNGKGDKEVMKDILRSGIKSDPDKTIRRILGLNKNNHMVEILKKMLILDKDRRITAKEALLYIKNTF